MSHLKDKKVIVTGGSRGFGRGIVQALTAAGATVHALARTAADLDQLKREVEGIQTCVADVTDPNLAAQILREVRPNILVLNAGAPPSMQSIYEQSCPVAQVQALLRADDPLYELGLRLGFVHRAEDRFWTDTLTALAAHCGGIGQVQQQVACLDPKMQWSRAKNIWYNAAIRTTLYGLTWPLRQIQAVFVRRR